MIIMCFSLFDAEVLFLDFNPDAYYSDEHFRHTLSSI